MFEHSETVTLAGKEYSIRCDINVLIEIQDILGSLTDFEMKIAGLRTARKQDGTVMMNEKNEIIFDRVEPSLKTIRDFLPFMLQEANQDTDLTEAMDAITNVRFNLYDVAVKMHNEYSKCFERKNR